MENSQQNLSGMDEISSKELILKIESWIKFLFSKWKIILLAGIIGGGLGLGLAFILAERYQAEMTFVVEDNSANPLSSYMGLASQFGIDLGVSTSTGVFQGDNILEFLKSRLMLERTLLTPLGDKRHITLADSYIEFNELHHRWRNKPGLKDISFPVGLERSKFTLLQDSVLNVIQTSISERNLKVEKPDKKLNFISVKCISEDELFSKVFVEHLVSEVITFYIDSKTKRTKASVDRLQQQADSIRYLLDQKTFSAARVQDLNSNPARQVAGVSTELATRDKLVLQTMYGEVVKNLEISKIAMSQETPLVQVVDVPILPLEVKKLGKLKALIIGGILAGFIIITWLICRRIYQMVMES